MKKLLHFSCIFFVIGMTLFQSCDDDEDDGPVKAGIFYSVADKQVAFTALTLRIDSWTWDFGDGETSSEKDPVHIYEEGGTYAVTLTATGQDTTIVATAEISLALSAVEMLTGGSRYPDGKKWKISSAHSEYDALALADATFTPIEKPLPSGTLGLVLGLGEEYEDEFTFKSDGSYLHDTENGGALTAQVFALVTQKQIIKMADYGLCLAAYTPESNATFTFTEGKDLTIATTNYPTGNIATEVTYKNVNTISFSGTEFIGLMDFTREVIVQELTPDKMRLVMFMSATSGAHYNKPAIAVIFTFEKVN